MTSGARDKAIRNLTLFSGGAAAALWAVLALWLIQNRYGFERLGDLPPDELPILGLIAIGLPALFVLTLVCIRQAMSLGQQRRDIEILRKQVETLSRSPVSPIDAATAFQMAERAISDLVSITGNLAEGFGLLDSEQAVERWRHVGVGDRWAFCHDLLPPGTDRERRAAELSERLGPKPELRALVSQFTHDYRALLGHLRRLGVDNLMRESVEQGALGAVQALLEAVERHDAETKGRAALIGLPPAAAASRVARLFFGDSQTAVRLEPLAAAVPPFVSPAAAPEPIKPQPEMPPAAQIDEPVAIPAKPSGKVVPFSPLSPGFPRMKIDGDDRKE